MDSQTCLLLLEHRRAFMTVCFSLLANPDLLLGEVYEFYGEIDVDGDETICRALLVSCLNGADMHLLERIVALTNKESADICSNI